MKGRSGGKAHGDVGTLSELDNISAVVYEKRV